MSKRGVLGSGRSLLMSTRQADVDFRNSLYEKHLAAGANKAEAERLMLLDLFREEVRHLLKKVPATRLHAAIDETMVAEVMES